MAQALPGRDRVQALAGPDRVRGVHPAAPGAHLLAVHPGLGGRADRFHQRPRRDRPALVRPTGGTGPARPAHRRRLLRRHAATDGIRVVWSCAGSLWTLASLDPAVGATPERLGISLGGPRSGRAPHRVPAKGHLGTTAPDRAARASAVEVRGTVQWLPHRDGPVRVLAATPGVRARMPVVLGATGRVAWVTDADGEDAIELAPAGAGTVPVTGTVDPTTPVRLAAGLLGTVLELVASPDGAVLAVASHDGRLLTVDVASGAVAEVARTEHGDVTAPGFSPDSRWLAWSNPGPSPLAHIRLRALDGSVPTGETVDVTPLRLTDTSPAFTADGKHLAFLSVRSLDPAYDEVVFDMSFTGGWRPYLVPLAAATASPFDPSGQGRGAEPRTQAEEAAADVAAVPRTHRRNRRSCPRRGPAVPEPNRAGPAEGGGRRSVRRARASGRRAGPRVLGRCPLWRADGSACPGLGRGCE